LLLLLLVVVVVVVVVVTAAAAVVVMVLLLLLFLNISTISKRCCTGDGYGKIDAYRVFGYHHPVVPVNIETIPDKHDT
jgi:hypothetical protein